MAEIGILGMVIPSEYGGQPLDYVTKGLVAKELARGDVNCAHAASASGTNEIIAKHADEEIKKDWLPEIAGGKKIVALAITEPHCGSDVAAMSAKAEKKNG